MRKTFVIVGTVVGVIALYVFFLWASYIDHTVRHGEAYGFRIGDTKIETYVKAREVFKGKIVYILYPIGGDMHGPHYEFRFTDDEYSILADRSSWKIYMDKGYFNLIRLKFTDEQLIEIHRHRKYFEGP